METEAFQNALKSIARNLSQISCAEVLWSKCQRIVVSSAAQGLSVSYHDMASRRKYELGADDVQLLAQKGLGGLRKSVNERIESENVDFYRYLESNRHDAAQRLFDILADEKGYDGEVKNLAGQLLIKTLATEIFNVVTPMLNVENDYIRYQAINLLSWIEDPRVIVPLMAALQDTDADIRIKAATGLAEQKVSDKRVSESLTTLLETESIPAVKDVIRKALRKIEERHRQEEENKRRHDQQIEESRRQEEEKRQRQGRRDAGLCEFCGKRVSLIRRIFTNTNHANCRKYSESS
jgi:hypothetical protein